MSKSVRRNSESIRSFTTMLRLFKICGQFDKKPSKLRSIIDRNRPGYVDPDYTVREIQCHVPKGVMSVRLSHGALDSLALKVGIYRLPSEKRVSSYHHYFFEQESRVTPKEYFDQGSTFKLFLMLSVNKGFMKMVNSFMALASGRAGRLSSPRSVISLRPKRMAQFVAAARDIADREKSKKKRQEQLDLLLDRISSISGLSHAPSEDADARLNAFRRNNISPN